MGETQEGGSGIVFTLAAEVTEMYLQPDLPVKSGSSAGVQVDMRIDLPILASIYKLHPPIFNPQDQKGQVNV